MCAPAREGRALPYCLAAAALAAAAAAPLGTGLLARSRCPPGFEEASDEGRSFGAWHVHTRRSDGRGTDGDVARAAREAGLQFAVLADHNVDPLPPRRVEGVLLVDAVEVSAPSGHVVALGVTRAPAPEERGTVLRWVHRGGGEAYLAHPTHPARGWRDDAAALSADGAEALSLDTGLHLLRTPARLVPALLAYPLAPDAVLQAALAPDPGAFALVRRMREMGSPGIRLCAVDAHGFPPYERMFRTVRLELNLALPRDPAEAARALRRAIAEGSGLCRVAGAGERAPEPDADGVSIWTAPGLLHGTRQAVATFPLRAP